MESGNLRIDQQVRFWAILGPCMLLFIFAITLVKFSPTQLLLPFIAMIGLFLCWQWKLKGLVVSLLGLGGLFLFRYASIPVYDLYWTLGMYMAVALAYVVTALSYEEIEEAIARLQTEASRNSKQTAQLEEKFYKDKAAWESDKEKLEANLEWMREVNQDKETEARRWRKKCQTLDEQTNVLRVHEEEYRHELEKCKATSLQLKNQVEALNRDKAALESRLDHECKNYESKTQNYFKESKASAEKKQQLEKELQHQQRQIQDQEEKLRALNESMAAKAELSSELEKKEKAWQEEKERLEIQLKSLQEQISQSQTGEADEEKAWQKEKLRLEEQIQTLSEQKNNSGEIEIAPNGENYRSLYKQIRKQFEDKGNLLDQTRKELFAAHEKVACLEKDLEEFKQYGRDEEIAQLEKQLAQTVVESRSIEKSYASEIEGLHSLIDSLMQS